MRRQAPVLRALAALLCFAMISTASHAAERIAVFRAPQEDRSASGTEPVLLDEAVVYAHFAVNPGQSAKPTEILLTGRDDGHVRWRLPLMLPGDSAAPELAATAGGRIVAHFSSADWRLVVIDAQTGRVVARHDTGGLSHYGMRAIGDRFFAFGWVLESGNLQRPAAIELDAQGALVRRIDDLPARLESGVVDVLPGTEGAVLFKVQIAGGQTRLFPVDLQGNVGPELVPPPMADAPGSVITLNDAIPHAGGWWLAGGHRVGEQPSQPYLVSIDPSGNALWQRSDLAPGVTSGVIRDLALVGGELRTLGWSRSTDRFCAATLRLAGDGTGQATGQCDDLPLDTGFVRMTLAADGSASAVGSVGFAAGATSAFAWSRSAAGAVDLRTSPLRQAGGFNRITVDERGAAYAHGFTEMPAYTSHVVFGLAEFASGTSFEFEADNPVGAMTQPLPVANTRGSRLLLREDSPDAPLETAVLDAQWNPISRAAYMPALPGYEPEFAIADADGAVYSFGRDDTHWVIATHSATPWSFRLPYGTSIPDTRTVAASGAEVFALVLASPSGCRVLGMDAQGVSRDELLPGGYAIAMLRTPQGRWLALCGNDAHTTVFDVTSSPPASLGTMPCARPRVGMNPDGSLVAVTFPFYGSQVRVCRRNAGGSFSDRLVTFPPGSAGAWRLHDGVMSLVLVNHPLQTLVHLQPDDSLRTATLPDSGDPSNAVLAIGPDGSVLLDGSGTAFERAFSAVGADGQHQWSSEFSPDVGVLKTPFTVGRAIWDEGAPILYAKGPTTFGGPDAVIVKLDPHAVFGSGFE